MSATAPRLDPITFEVLRHKLDEIVAEAYYTIGRVSGSPVVYESGDHQEAILNPAGDLVAFGASALTWVRSISEGVRGVVAEFDENPGFAEGDQFIVNDPYTSSVHASDVQLLAPVFGDGRIIAWVGTASHQPDTGGVNPGGHHVDAGDVYAEGFQTRGLKLVERGRIRRDIEQTFANMVRQADLGLLDLRAKIASNNVMRERLLGLVERYGVETISALFDQVIEYSEMRLRSRLASLPDGLWQGTSWIEGMIEPELSVTVALTKQGDSLTYDFAGTSPQSVGPENIGVPGAQSAAIDPLIISLCHDLPWNEGLFRPIEFLLPEGSLVNPIRPAPVSANVPSGGCALVTAATQVATSQMLMSSDEFAGEASGGSGGCFNFPVFAGANRDGTPFASLILDGLAGGSGALAHGDGDDSGHTAWSVKVMIANVETTEMIFPLLYLWRRETTDSAGAGKFRGGVGINAAIIPWEVPHLAVVNVGVGADSRGTPGVAGGYPGANTPLTIQREADVDADRSRPLPTRPGELAGRSERIAPKGTTMIDAGEPLVIYASTGGGGFGDPLDRDPRLVLADIDSAAVSPEMARGVYGVALGLDGEVDHAATEGLRAEARTARLALAARRPAEPETAGGVRCADCGPEAGRAAYDAPIATAEPQELAAAHELFALRHTCCGRCGRLLDVRLVNAAASQLRAS